MWQELKVFSSPPLNILWYCTCWATTMFDDLDSFHLQQWWTIHDLSRFSDIRRKLSNAHRTSSSSPMTTSKYICWTAHLWHQNLLMDTLCTLWQWKISSSTKSFQVHFNLWHPESSQFTGQSTLWRNSPDLNVFRKGLQKKAFFFFYVSPFFHFASLHFSPGRDCSTTRVTSPKSSLRNGNARAKCFTYLVT